MKIVDIDCFRLDMKLAVPYTIAYETVTKTTNIILKMTTDSGLTGWGCAAPDTVVTGETADQVLKNATSTLTSILKGTNPFQIARITDDLKKALGGKASSTIAMVDMTLYDLLARKADIPLYQLLGGYRNSIPTSITIGIESLTETIAIAENHLANGFFILKLKGGISLEEDIEKVLKLREKFGKDFLLRFDANQGYSFEQSVQFLERVKSAKVEIIEQPTCRTQEENLGQVTQAVTVPVMADESIKTLGDAFRFAANDYIDMINIKLMKMGGIFESLHINSVAKAAGMEVMVGCLDESALGISAGMHFALSRANIEYADLDGHLDMMGDPFTSLFQLEKGIMYPSDSAGLGTITI